ncbi:hypothetical protein Tco_1508849 [Tanacetum coccineum]
MGEALVEQCSALYSHRRLVSLRARLYVLIRESRWFHREKLRIVSGTLHVRDVQYQLEHARFTTRARVRKISYALTQTRSSGVCAMESGPCAMREDHSGMSVVVLLVEILMALSIADQIALDDALVAPANGQIWRKMQIFAEFGYPHPRKPPFKWSYDVAKASLVLQGFPITAIVVQRNVMEKDLSIPRRNKSYLSSELTRGHPQLQNLQEYYVWLQEQFLLRQRFSKKKEAEPFKIVIKGSRQETHSLMLVVLEQMKGTGV